MSIAFPTTYTPPVSNGDKYLKFTPGKHYFRILSSPIIGWEYWSKSPQDQKSAPKRSAHRPSETEMIYPEIRNGEKSFPKEFYAFKVFVYDDNTRTTGSIKILSTTVKSIKNDLYYYLNSPDFGSADGYDFVMERTGEKLTTEYKLIKLDSTPKGPALIEAEDKTPVNLNALYVNGDPFQIDTMDGVFAENM